MGARSRRSRTSSPSSPGPTTSSDPSPPGTTFTLVHDYDGIAEWMTGRWQTKDAVVREIIAACRLREMERGLNIAFHHQRGHQAISYNEYARYNARADALATQGGRD